MFKIWAANISILKKPGHKMAIFYTIVVICKSCAKRNGEIPCGNGELFFV